MRLKQFASKSLRGFGLYLHQELKIRPGYDFCVPRGGIINAPRVLTVLVNINPKYYKKIEGITRELSMAMMLDKDVSIRVTRGHGPQIRLEVPKPKDLCFILKDKHIPSHSLFSEVSAIGVDGDLRPVLIDFKDPLQSHLLVSGITGSGKTVTQRAVVLGLAKTTTPEQVKFFVLDTAKRGRNWKDFNKLPHLGTSIVVEEDQAIKAVKLFERELDDRMKNNLVPPEVPRWILVVDEISDLIEGEYGNVFAKSLERIARLGREYAMNLNLATQYPLISQLGSSVLKRQLGVRLVGKMDDGIAAKAAAGVENSGAQYLTGAGDFLCVNNGKVTRLQVALPTDLDRIQYTSNGKIKLDDVTLPNTNGKHKEIDYDVVAQLLAAGTKRNKFNKEISAHSLGSWCKPRVSAAKVERHWKIASDLVSGLKDQGFCIQPC